MKTVKIERHRCVGAGQCVFYAPELFRQNEDDGLIEQVRAVTDTAEDMEALEAAAMACPTAALQLDE